MEETIESFENKKETVREIEKEEKVQTAQSSNQNNFNNFEIGDFEDFWDDQLIYDFYYDHESEKIEQEQLNLKQNNNFNFKEEIETFDLYEYFEFYNQLYFDSKLGCIRVEWSKRMTLCAGIFSYKNEDAVIRLSEPLLKYRTIDEIKETLLHEMIHAYNWVEQIYDEDKGGHGAPFKMKMYEINKNTGLNITVYHSFHDEVEYHRKYVWRCTGKCRDWKPYFGYVRRAMNRKPSPSDYWWKNHEENCGGEFIRIDDEPDKNKEKKIETKVKIEENSILPDGSNIGQNKPKKKLKKAKIDKTQIKIDKFFTP